MIKQHTLTEEELKELYSICKLLSSDDEESKRLGIGLLKEYPQNIRVKKDFYDHFRDGKINGYSTTLDIILLDYENGIIIPSDIIVSFFHQSITGVIDFISNMLLDQCYYFEEDDKL